MKRIILLASLLIALAASAFAQTTVTLQVTDADSITWNNAPYTVTLTSTLANAQNGAVASVSSTLSASGAASISLAANTYTFRVCPLAASRTAGTYGNIQVLCYSSSTAISGSTQTVTLAPPAIRIPLNVAGISVLAYSDIEVTLPLQGAKYFNLVFNVERTFNGTLWIDTGSAGAVVFAALPACATGLEGTKRSISDSTTVTWGATITGGSSSHVLAYCDGTNWTVEAK